MKKKKEKQRIVVELHCSECGEECIEDGQQYCTYCGGEMTDQPDEFFTGEENDDNDD